MVPVRSTRGRGRLVALVAVLVVACGVAACSQDGAPVASSAASTTAPTRTTATATGTAGASSTTGGPVTAESLSDPEIDYEVTSIPENLDATQTEALTAFIAFEHFTWRLWLTPAGSGTGIEGIEEYTSVEAAAQVRQNYNSITPGEYMTGPVRDAVLKVEVHDQHTPFEAIIVVCLDQTQTRLYNEAGEDISYPEHQGRFEYRYMLSTVDGPWKVVSEELLSTNECTV